MPRIRSTKPEHWEDNLLPNISLGAHLLWIGMWNFSDDKGVIERDYHLIKSNVFPRRKEVKPLNIEKWIKELIKFKFVLPFEDKGIQYLIHRTFHIHQRIDKPQPSKISEEVILRVFQEHSTNDTGEVDEHSNIVLRKERIGEDRRGKGEDRKGGEAPENFKLYMIYNKKFEELNGAFNKLSEKGFLQWKKFVDFILKKNYNEIFNCKFITPQDFEKIDFPESAWDETVKSLLSTGIKPEHNLYFRIPKFIKYGLETTKGSGKRPEITGTGGY